MLVKPARPRSWKSGKSCPSSGEGFTSPAELRGAVGTHGSSKVRVPWLQFGCNILDKMCRFPSSFFLVVNCCSSPVMWSSEKPACFHVPILVGFPRMHRRHFGYKFSDLFFPPPTKVYLQTTDTKWFESHYLHVGVALICLTRERLYTITV